MKRLIGKKGSMVPILATIFIFIFFISIYFISLQSKTDSVILIHPECKDNPLGNCAECSAKCKEIGMSYFQSDFSRPLFGSMTDTCTCKNGDQIKKIY